MAARRARIKLAPNLGLTRNKARPQPVKPKIVITSDTDDLSESDAGADVESAGPNTKNSPEESSQEIFNGASEGRANGWPGDTVNGKTVNGTDQGEDCQTIEITPVELQERGEVEEEISSTSGDQVQPQSQLNRGLSGKAKPVLRNKFRPNLNIERGQRSLVSRVRTVSSSSTNSESDSTVRPPPDSPILRSAILTPRPARVRRTTESRSTLGERTQFHNRRQVHKAKFSRGVPDRTNLTMFDLIYYNPQHGKRMSVEDEEDIEKVDDPDDPTVDDDEQTEKVEKTEAIPKEEDERAEALPVPRVKVGINGEIILDEASLHVETTQQKEAKVLLKAAPLVFENNKTSFAYGRWSKKRRHKDWTEKETLKFYKALSVVGSDFSMMESIFSNRSRSELRLKFKKEEKVNSKMVDKCLNERRMFTDLDSLINASEDEVEDVESGRKSRSKKGLKKRPRRRYKNRGLYDSSSGSGGEDGDIDTSKSPVRKRMRNGSGDPAGALVQRVKRPLVVREEEGVVGGEEPVLDLPDLSGVEFPPGLLAANPSLAGAKPGSLVVVAGPQKAQDTRSPLHLYMVQVKEKKVEDDPRPVTGRTVSFGSTVTELRLDPAVMRAVDRGKLHRQRTLSECDGEEKVLGSGEVRGRKRTHSESSGLPATPGQSLRSRFLSGSDG